MERLVVLSVTAVRNIRVLAASVNEPGTFTWNRSNLNTPG